MCEANAYLRRENVEELIMEGVDRVVPEGEEILLVNIFGQQRRLRARIAEMQLVDHRIILERHGAAE